jgi:hypothetical protein
MASNMTYQEFADNFITHVRAIENEHTDNGEYYEHCVGFNVVCRNNNRVIYFERHLGSNDVPPNPTVQQVVDASWSNLLPTIKEWAETAITESNLLGSIYVPSSNLPFTTQSNINLPTFTSNFTTKIARMEVYPPVDPKSWCVGFSVNKNAASNEYMYIDTNVVVDSFSISVTEGELLDMGWSNTKETIGVWAAKKQAEPEILNTVYLNSNVW